ncbi:hypothetical protein RclHR1_07310011 [Rhizophagus clarus]|uniref:Uncharacterized protein n=1 Tax=Rhizophagus clarus TaxID=94130 RepID=A0A2Z6SL62_9GLOM|nr:hypothetical protein RclHR1_07310011 [Rhizophagus clarus]
MESSNNDSRIITCSSKIDLRSSKNDSRMIINSSKIDLRSSKNDSNRFTSYGQKAIAEAKKNNLLEEFAQNFPSPKEHDLLNNLSDISKFRRFKSSVLVKFVGGILPLVDLDVDLDVNLD